jgi:hypothetical protein
MTDPVPGTKLQSGLPSEAETEAVADGIVPVEQVHPPS